MHTARYYYDRPVSLSVCLSVCLPVAAWNCIKTTKARTTITSPIEKPEDFSFCEIRTASSRATTLRISRQKLATFGI